MDLLLISVIAVIVIALIFDFTNGFHDAANSVATVVATRALPGEVGARLLGRLQLPGVLRRRHGRGQHRRQDGQERVRGSRAGLRRPVRGHRLELPHLALRHAVLVQPRHHRRPGRRRTGGRRARGHRLVERREGRHRHHPVAGGGVRASPSWPCTSCSASRSCPSGTTTTRCSRASSSSAAAGVSFGHGANDAQKTMGVIAALLLGAGYTEIGADGKTIEVPEWAALSRLRGHRPRHPVGRLEDHRDDGPEDHHPARELGPRRQHRCHHGHLRRHRRRACRSRPPTPPPPRSSAPASARARARTGRSSARWCSPG